MARLPQSFQEEFDEKGDTFHKIAKILYTNPDRQYTQGEIAEMVDKEKPTVSGHTMEMIESGWIRKREEQTTFVWDSDAHNPSSTEGFTATKRFYSELWYLFKKHSKTTPGMLTIIGSISVISSLMLFMITVGYILGLSRDPPVEISTFVAIFISLLIGGAIITFLSPLIAILHKTLEIISDRYIR